MKSDFAGLAQPRSKMHELRPTMQTVMKLLLAGLIMSFHLATLSSYPAPFVDEGWLGSRAWTFCVTKQTFGPLDRGVFDRFPGYGTYFPWLPNWLQSIMYTNSEAPEYFPLRLLSFLSGVVLLIAVFAIGKRVGGTRVAWLSIFLVMLSRPFVYSSHLARYDILVAAFGFGAIALALRTGPNVVTHWLAGLAVAAAFEIHPAGALYGPPVVAMYFVREDSAKLKDRRIWSFIGGVLTGLAIYAALHIIRYPETWLAINRIAGGGTHTPPLLDPAEMMNSFRHFLRLAAYTSPYLISLVPIAALYFVFRRNPENLILLVLMIGLLLSHNLLLQHKFSYYAILFSPVLDLAIARFVVQLAAERLTRFVKLATMTVVLFLIGCSMVYAVHPLRWDWSTDYYRVRSELRRQIKTNETVMGNQLWWFALPSENWFSWENLYYYKRFRPGASLEDAFHEFRPRIFLLDAHVESFLQNGQTTGYAKQFGISKSELEQILNRYGRMRAEFDGGYYGRIRIFELNGL